MLNGKTIGFLGSGAIAEALVRGIVKAGLVKPDHIWMNDVVSSRLDYLHETHGIRTSLVADEVISGADLLFLTVKPQVIAAVLAELPPSLRKDTLVVSVAAGVSINRLEAALPGQPVIRVMPNTPVAVGEGMAAYSLGQAAGEEHAAMVAAIFDAAGKSVRLDEHLMDAVTGLSGSGPGYAFVMIDALADAGVRVGLPRQQALLMAAQTLLGAAKMVLETGEHPAKLRDMVTSPGGTTIAGIHKMEERGVRAALIDTVIAATERSRELGKH